MKKYLSILVGLIMVFGASSAFAANDLTLSSGVVISVGDISLTVSGDEKVIDSITVNSDSFSVTLSPGVRFSVSSADKWKMSTDSAAGISATQLCASDSNLVVVASSDNTSSVTTTITPSTTTKCDGTAVSDGNVVVSSGGGGGGGASANNPNYNLYSGSAASASSQASAAPQVSLPAQASATAGVATAAASAAHTFRTYLKLGSTGTDVTELQKKLTDEGVYSGPITGYFGSLTQAGVKKYQAKYGIDQLGVVGPATRAQLNLVSASVQQTTSQSATTQTVEALQAQLQALQAQLLQLLNQKLQGLQSQ